ncbi:thrombospondin type-1 domain-containing protein [Bdellovibrio sp. HCB185ZH]|uniref:thrombospondin type-1 domain-containing protein n=1 Tax=Bdellovibrio sp. HCB185ZH TaxID=3394235 RepID=UPI0039A6CD00
MRFLNVLCILIATAYLAACSLDLKIRSGLIVDAQINLIKNTAKADNIDEIVLEATLVNKETREPLANHPVTLLIDNEANNPKYKVTCGSTNSQGKGICTITSSTWSKVKLRVDTGDPVNEVASVIEELAAKDAIFFDINSSAYETYPGSFSSYANADLGVVSVTISSRTTENNPVIGMTPRMNIMGPGTATFNCSLTDANGEAICVVQADIAGTYEIEVITPRLEHTVPIVFVESSRSCTIANATASESWGQGGSATWGACKITTCDPNYTRTSDTTCVADNRACVPFPVGADNATQLWEESLQDTWGACIITACKINYNLNGSGGGNTCVAATRIAPPEELPSHATAGEQTWDGTTWGPVVVSKCEYPYKVVSANCTMSDITPDAFVLLDKFQQPLDQDIYSDAIVIAGTEQAIEVAISGDPTAFAERLPQSGTDWLPFDPDTEKLSNGDSLRLGVHSAATISTTSSVIFSLGAMGPLEWKATTRDSLPPTDITLLHNDNEKDFTISWDTGGLGNAPSSCEIQIRKNGTAWTTLGSAVDCDSPLTATTLQLPSGVGFSNDWNATGIPLRILRTTDSVELTQLSDRLNCIPDPAQPAVDDPNRDENCNTNWIDDADSNPPVGGSFTIDEASPVASPLIHLAIVCATDAEGPVSVAYGETSPPTNFEACTGSVTLELSAGTGLKTVYLQFSDAVGNTLPVISHTIFLDQTLPAGGSLQINSGAPATNSANVTLNLTCPLDNGIPAKVAFSELPTPGDPAVGSDWETCLNSMPFTLSNGNENKTVYVRYIDEARNVSNDISSDIVLDSDLPTGSLTYTDGWQNSYSISLSASAADATTSIAQCEMQVAEAPISSGVVGNFGSFTTISNTCGNQSFTTAVNNMAYQFRYKITDLAGNSNIITSASITKVDTQAPLGGDFNFVQSSPVVTPGVTLNITCASDENGSSRMAFGENASPTNWQTCVSSKSYTLTSGTGTKTVYLRFIDDYGNVSGAVSHAIDLDQTPHGTGALLINDDAEFTNTLNVNLQLDCVIQGGLPQQSALGNFVDPGDPGNPGDWSTCVATPQPYTLPAGDGIKSVHVRYVDDTYVASADFSDSIILDTTAPTASVSYLNGWQTSTAISITASESDATSGIDECDLQQAQATLTAGVPGAFSAWTTVSTDCSNYATTGANGSAYKFRYRVRDGAGNYSAWNDPGTTTKIDNAPPTGGGFAIATPSPTGTTAINLNITCATDTQSTPQVAFGETASPTNWQACAGTKALTLSTGSGTKTIYMRFKDANGNISNTVSRSIYLDQTAPTGGSVTINGGAAYTNSLAATLTLACPLDNGTATKIAVGNATNPGNPAVASDWQTCTTSLAYSLPTGVGTKTIYVRYLDAVGNVSATVSDSIYFDNVVPTASITYANAWQTTATISVTATQADANAGINSCILQLAQATITSGTVGAYGAWANASTTCGNFTMTGVSGKAYKFQYQSTDKAGNVSTWSAPASVVKIDTSAPSGGSVTNANAIQTTTGISIPVNRGSDTNSGMSATNTDYTLQVAYATLNTSTLACGAFGAFADTGASESATATTYSYTGVQGRCYQFRYIVKNAAGIAATYTGTNITKINYTYAWSIGAFGACNGGSGSWAYGSWSACSGGSGTWGYSAWGSCSLSCGGGTQTRTATCNKTASSGSQTRTATCNKNANSGSQTRTVTCTRSDSTTVADSFCGTKPATSQACTPTSNTVCGTAVTSQACTPTSNTVCGTQGATSQACNTQVCCTNANNSTNMCPGNTYTYQTMSGGGPGGFSKCASGSGSCGSGRTASGNIVIYDCRCN